MDTLTYRIPTYTYHSGTNKLLGIVPATLKEIVRSKLFVLVAGHKSLDSAFPVKSKSHQL